MEMEAHAVPSSELQKPVRRRKPVPQPSTDPNHVVFPHVRPNKQVPRVTSDYGYLPADHTHDYIQGDGYGQAVDGTTYNENEAYTPGLYEYPYEGGEDYAPYYYEGNQGANTYDHYGYGPTHGVAYDGADHGTSGYEYGADHLHGAYEYADDGSVGYVYGVEQHNGAQPSQGYGEYPYGGNELQTDTVAVPEVVVNTKEKKPNKDVHRTSESSPRYQQHIEQSQITRDGSESVHSRSSNGRSIDSHVTLNREGGQIPLVRTKDTTKPSEERSLEKVSNPQLDPIAQHVRRMNKKSSAKYQLEDSMIVSHPQDQTSIDPKDFESSLRVSESEGGAKPGGRPRPTPKEKRSYANPLNQFMQLNKPTTFNQDVSMIVYDPQDKSAFDLDSYERRPAPPPPIQEPRLRPDQRRQVGQRHGRPELTATAGQLWPETADHAYNPTLEERGSSMHVVDNHGQQLAKSEPNEAVMRCIHNFAVPCVRLGTQCAINSCRNGTCCTIL